LEEEVKRFKICSPLQTAQYHVRQLDATRNTAKHFPSLLLLRHRDQGRNRLQARRGGTRHLSGGLGSDGAYGDCLPYVGRIVHILVKKGKTVPRQSFEIQKYARIEAYRYADQKSPDQRADKFSLTTSTALKPRPLNQKPIYQRQQNLTAQAQRPDTCPGLDEDRSHLSRVPPL